MILSRSLLRISKTDNLGAVTLLARFIHSIKDINTSYETLIGKEIEVSGWVKSVRKQKDFVFMHINDGTHDDKLQLLWIKNETPEKDRENIENALKRLNFGASIEARGILSKSTHPKQKFELIMKNINVINECDAVKYPFKGKQEYDLEYLRKYPHLRTNMESYANIARFRSHLNSMIQKYFLMNDFYHVHTPILTRNNCEGGCDTFEVQTQDFKTEAKNYFFTKPTYLTASAQLHLEALTNSLAKVFTISPTFRAEKSLSKHHLAEFYMIEAELVHMKTLDQLLSVVEGFLKYICSNIFETLSESQLNSTVKYLNLIDEKRNYIDFIKEISKKPFVKLPYEDAIKILNNNFNNIAKLSYGDDLGKDHEKSLIKFHENTPIFVINFPRSLKPFYMRQSEKNEEIVENFDLLVPNVGELVGGSLREHRYDILVQSMKQNKIDLNSYKYYLETKMFGGMMMGGFGVGFERLMQFLMNIENIKDTTLFPRYWNHCKM